MKGDQQGRQSPQPILRFMSINVGRGGKTHEIALARACELQLDILLVQEPWWLGFTKSHPYFDRHIPHSSNNSRPRAITYTKMDRNNIHASQVFPLSVPNGDYCWVVVNGITFLNLYKAPQDPTAVEPLLSLTPLLFQLRLETSILCTGPGNPAPQSRMVRVKISKNGPKHTTFHA